MKPDVVEALNDIDWGLKTLSVRINGLDTEYMHRDVVEVVEGCPRLDMLVIPKVNVAADVYAVELRGARLRSATRANGPSIPPRSKPRTGSSAPPKRSSSGRGG